ncbi:MAG: hypothetical protein ACFFAE_22800 [Candidatus Hodarchaeota archaeon]
MGLSLKTLPKQDKYIKIINSVDISRDRDVPFLDEGKVIVGYSAALIYIMNGLAKAVYIVGKISSIKQEILSSNCQISSVPIFNVNTSNIGYKKGSILTVVH